MRAPLKLVMAALAVPISAPAASEPGDHAGDREVSDNFGVEHDTHERSDFDRAIDRAPHEAQDRAERESAVRADREASETRREAGVERRGVDAGGGNRVSVEPREGGGVVNVQRDWDPK